MEVVVERGQLRGLAAERPGEQLVGEAWVASERRTVGICADDVAGDSSFEVVETVTRPACDGSESLGAVVQSGRASVVLVTE